MKNVNNFLNIVLRIVILVSKSRFWGSRNPFRYSDFTFEDHFTKFKIVAKMASLKIIKDNIFLNIGLGIMILVSMGRFIMSRIPFRYSDIIFEALLMNYKMAAKMASMENYKCCGPQYNL